MNGQPKRKVWCMNEMGFNAKDFEEWLNSLPGHLVSVVWAGGAGLVAITEHYS